MSSALLVVAGITAVAHPAHTRPVAATTATAVNPFVQSGPQSIIHRVQDTYITNADSADHSQEAVLHIGTPDSGKTAYRSFMQFDVSKLKGAVIKSASLRLFEYGTGSCSGWWMYAYPVTSAWSQSTINWSNQPGVNTTTDAASANFGIGATGCPVHPNYTDPDSSDGIHRLDITAMVRAGSTARCPTTACGCRPVSWARRPTRASAR